MNKLPALIFAAAAALLAGCAAAIDPTDSQAIYDAARAEFDKDKWLHSKRFTLAQATSTEGEGNIGQYPHSRQAKHIAGETMTYYVSTAECDSDNCRELQPYAEKIAGDFIAQYNALVEREVLRLGKDGGGDVPIYLRDTPKYIGGKVYGWNCPGDETDRDFYDGVLTACSVYVRFVGEKGRVGHQRVVVRNILATLGLWSTRNAVFGDCATYYDPKYIKAGHGIRFGGKLCEYDIFAILFIDRYVKPGMSAKEIDKLFEEHAKSVRDEMIAEGLGK